MTQLIDKEDVLREISSSDDVFVTEAEQEYLWERIQMLPTVDAVPVRHGRWVEHKDYPGIAWLCSECGHFTTMQTYHYCPDCGAMMDEEKEE